MSNVTKDEVLERLTEVFRSMFDDPSIQLAATTTADDVDGWDSLMHINLIVAIEKEFRVKFATAEVTLLKNVGDLVELIHRKSN
jgi:acyl carrier protein